MPGLVPGIHALLRGHAKICMAGTIPAMTNVRECRAPNFDEPGLLHTMTTLFTILFDGVAYGMLLFVLACGLAVTLGLMNFVNLAHGAFAMTGGYICAVLVNNSGWPFFAALPLAFVSSAADRRGAGAHALPPSLHPQPSRPGAVHDRPRLHVGGGGRLHHGIVARSSSNCRRRSRGSSISSASASAATG